MRTAGRLLLALMGGCAARHCSHKEIEAKDITGCVTVKHTKYMGHKKAIWLGDALHHNPHLKILDLHDTRFGDEDAISLASGLHNNTHLKRLHLHNNRIYDAGAAALGKALLENDALEFLSLSTNGVGDEGAKAIAEGLRGNRALRRLDLYFNLIGDAGAKAIADALKVNRGLRLLHLDTNRIDDDGGLALAEALQGSRPGVLSSGHPPSALGELGLSYNPMGNAAADALMLAAEANPTLHELNLHNLQGVKGPSAKQLKEVHVHRMHERHRLAHYLVVHKLITSEGFSEEATHGEVSDHRRGHGGWHSHDGPPLSSPYAAPVRALRAHTKEGLLALRHLSEAELRAHAALASLKAEERDALIPVLLATVKAAVQKDEV